MKLGKFTQTPTENKAYVIDYSQWLTSAEFVNSVTFAITQATTPPLVIGSQAISTDQTMVSFFVSGGVDRTDYEVEVTMTSSIGQIKNDQVFYVVRAL